MGIKIRQILLVNCDRAIEEMMQLCLETIPDSKVTIANSGHNAIEQALSVDAILLNTDKKMPDLSWLELITDLKQNPLTNFIPVILLNSIPQSQELLELQQVTQIKAIALSFDLSNLASQISALLDR